MKGRLQQMLENMFQSNVEKKLFYVAVYIEDMQGTFYTYSLYVIKKGVTRKNMKLLTNKVTFQ